jgi:hypothetical protein
MVLATRDDFAGSAILMAGFDHSEPSSPRRTPAQ